MGQLYVETLVETLMKNMLVWIFQIKQAYLLAESFY